MPSESLEGFGEVTTGSESQLDGKVSVASAVNDTLGLRFGANLRNRDGVYDDINNGDQYDEIDKESYRGQVYWLPSDAVSVRAAGYYSSSEGKVGSNDSQFDSDYVAGMAFLTGQDISSQIDTDPENRKVSRDFQPDTELAVKGASVQLDYVFDNGITFTSITAGQQWDMDGWGNDVDNLSLDVLSTNVYQEEDTFSQEFRLTSAGAEKIDWLVGAFYFDSDLQVGDINKPFAIWGQDLVPFLALAGHSFNHQADYTSESASIFGQATWNFTDSTSLTAGLRYAREDKDFRTRVDAFDATGTSVSQGGAIDAFGLNVSFSGLAATGLQPIDIEDDRSDSDVTGMISLNHFIGDTMLYATIATGTKSGGFNGNFGPTPLSAREYDKETSTNYEVGAKVDGLLNGRARVNAAVFYTVFEDFQTTIYDASIPGFTTSNAEEQTTAGVDLNATFLATENLVFNVSLEYLDAEFNDYDGAACHPSGPKATQVSATAFVCDFSGETPPFVADWSGTISASYVLPLATGSEFYAYAGYNFKTDHDTATDGYNKGSDDLENLDARLGWRNDNWDISAWGRNLTDDVYNLGYSENTFTASIFPALGLTQRQTYDRWLSEPRTYGLSVRYLF
jgi:iron complex outermembrane receptor protein